MRTFKVLGTGCSSCRTLLERVEMAASELDEPFVVEKVTDIADILAHDVAATPALVVDGEVRLAGRVPALDEVRELLR